MLVGRNKVVERFIARAIPETSKGALVHSGIWHLINSCIEQPMTLFVNNRAALDLLVSQLMFVLHVYFHVQGTEG